MDSKKILVVDDEPSVLRILQMKFEKAGFSVLTACDGLEALELIEKSEPDAVIMDNKMPNMTGIDLCASCEKIREKRRFLIIMLSSYASVTSKVDEKWVENLKDTFFVAKPFSPRKVLQIVEEYLKDGVKKAEKLGA